MDECKGRLCKNRPSCGGGCQLLFWHRRNNRILARRTRHLHLGTRRRAAELMHCVVDADHLR